MSVRMMTAVFSYSQSRLADRLVLLVIADKSDDDGTGCFRGKESIARLAHVSRSQVTRSIQRLTEMGELAINPRSGRTNEYRITLSERGSDCAAPPVEPGADVADPRPPVEPTPGQTGSRDTSSQPTSDAPANPDVGVGEWKPSERDLEAGARTLQAMRAAHGLATRNREAV